MFLLFLSILPACQRRDLAVVPIAAENYIHGDDNDMNRLFLFLT